MSKIVDRTLDFFELFSDQKRPLSLSEISRLLAIPPSSCHDVLQALQARGYIYEVARRGGFYPTRRLVELGRIISAHDPVLLRADAALRSLRDQLDESILLSKMNGLQATYLVALEPTHGLRISVAVGQALRSVSATSAGKALLASLDDSTLETYLQSAKLITLTPHSVKTADRLRAQLAEGRRIGYFVNRGESEEGVTTVSSFFRWNDSVYIVTVAGPTSRLDLKLTWAGELLVDVCKRLEMGVAETVEQSGDSLDLSLTAKSPP